MSGIAGGAAIVGGPVAGGIAGLGVGAISAGMGSNWDPAITSFGAGFGLGAGLLGGVVPAGAAQYIFSGAAEIWGWNAGAYGGLF